MPETDPVVTLLSDWTDVYMHGSMPNFIGAIKASGFSMSQIGALFHIRKHDVRGVAEIGDELGVSSAAASQMLDRLVQQGLVSRTEDPNDRRVKRLVLTDHGKQLLKKSIHARQEWIQDLATLLTPAEKEQVIAAMQILIAKANQLQQQPTREA